jgi:type VI secretion system protein ImpF
MPELFMPSLMDRLTDENPEERGRESEPFLQKKREWQNTLVAEIELLLNTKRAVEEVPEEFKHASESLLTYGVPISTGMSAEAPSTQEMLHSAIQAALRRFEPRLTSIVVTDETPRDERGRPTKGPALRFSVEALMRMEPVDEPIRFETILETDRLHFVVNKGA